MILNILLWIVFLSFITGSVMHAAMRLNDALGEGQEHVWIAVILGLLWLPLAIAKFAYNYTDSLEG